MLIAFLPFPTAVLAEAIHRGQDEPTACAFYSGTLTVLGLFINAMWWHAARGHRLLDARLSAAAARRIGRRFVVGPVVYALATGLALMLPWLAILLFLLLNVFYLWPRREPERVADGVGAQFPS